MPPHPCKLLVEPGSITDLDSSVPTQLPLVAPLLLLAPLDPKVVPLAPTLAPFPPPSQGALLGITLVPASQPSTPHALPSRHGSLTEAAALALQHTLVMATHAVTTMVDKSKDQIGYLIDLAVGHSAR